MLAVDGVVVLLTAAGRAEMTPTFSLVCSEITTDSSTGDGRGSIAPRANDLDAVRPCAPSHIHPR
jgi:hypothetical protein